MGAEIEPTFDYVLNAQWQARLLKAGFKREPHRFTFQHKALFISVDADPINPKFTDFEIFFLDHVLSSACSCVPNHYAGALGEAIVTLCLLFPDTADKAASIKKMARLLCPDDFGYA